MSAYVDVECLCAVMYCLIFSCILNSKWKPRLLTLVTVPSIASIADPNVHAVSWRVTVLCHPPVGRLLLLLLLAGQMFLHGEICEIIHTYRLCISLVTAAADEYSIIRFDVILPFLIAAAAAATDCNDVVIWMCTRWKKTYNKVDFIFLLKRFSMIHCSIYHYFSISPVSLMSTDRLLLCNFHTSVRWQFQRAIVTSTVTSIVTSQQWRHQWRLPLLNRPIHTTDVAMATDSCVSRRKLAYPTFILCVHCHSTGMGGSQNGCDF